jgi:hypothetical protein
LSKGDVFYEYTPVKAEYESDYEDDFLEEKEEFEE